MLQTTKQMSTYREKWNKNNRKPKPEKHKNKAQLCDPM